MRYKLHFIMLFFSVLSMNAQEENIELPDVDVQIGMRDYSPFKIFVTKENTIICNNDTISIYQIKEKFYDYTLKFLFGGIQTHIFADKDVSYSLIDSIKTEISSTNSSKYIVYRSNSSKNKGQKIKGIKHKSPLPFFSFEPPKYLKTKNEIKKRDSISNLQYKLNPDLPPIPNPNDNDWIQVLPSVERAIYSIQQDIIDEALLNKIVECYSISNKGLIDSNGNEVELSNYKLKEILQKNEVVFLKYETDLLYDSYIKFIKTLQDLKPNFKNSKHYAEVIELSYQIQHLHKKARIKLCN